MPRVLFIPGSLRAASSSRALTRALIEQIGSRAECTAADPGALPHYNADLQDEPAVAAFIAEVEQADGVVFVTPEYNYSVPGVLKNAIDWASRPAYASVFLDKPCFVITVSGGVMGGVRAQAHLKYILNGMLAKTFACKEVIVPSANASVTDGVFENAAVLDFAEANLADFLATLGS